LDILSKYRSENHHISRRLKATTNDIKAIDTPR
jgi:hypothetical protein